MNRPEMIHPGTVSPFGGSKRFRFSLRTVLSLAVIVPLAFSLPLTPGLRHARNYSSGCPFSGRRYAGYKTTHYGNEGIYGFINYLHDNMVLADNDTQSGTLQLYSQGEFNSGDPYGWVCCTIR